MDGSDDKSNASERSRSPIKINKRGKIVCSRERLLIVNMYKANLNKDPDMSMRKLRKLISESTGIGETTVHRTIKEYKETKTVTSPKRRRVRRSVLDKYDDLARNTVRKHVHNIWLRQENPTLDKIYSAVSSDDSLPQISRTNLHKLIKELHLSKYDGTLK